MSLNTWATKQIVGNLRVKADPFGIYAQRRALSKVIHTDVYRGDEWWTQAADKMIQDEIDRAQ